MPPARRARYQADRPQAMEGCHQWTRHGYADEGDAVGIELMQEVPSKLRAYLIEEFGPVAENKNWARDAFIKAHKGRLHRALGVPESDQIPAAKISEALAGKHGEAVRKMAQAAHNINK